MRTIARILHGSHLFGTSTENSDTDYKAVVIPSASEILIGNVNWSNVDGQDSTRPNSRLDIDEEAHDLLRYTRLLAQGQPIALEMLFAPKEFQQMDPDPVFHLLLENRERIISRQNGKFLGYCKRQALAYGLKGERVDAAEKAVEVLSKLIKEHGHREKLNTFIDQIISEVDSPHVHEECRTLVSGRVIRHVRVASKMAAETVNLKEAHDIASTVVKEYGKRARVAQEAQGKDWKALSHALRIGYEAVELFSTGLLTFPRPEAAHLLNVKKGLVHADRVGEEIVALLAEVEFASQNSILPDEADMELLNEIVISAHKDVVTRADLDIRCVASISP